MPGPVLYTKWFLRVFIDLGEKAVVGSPKIRPRPVQYIDIKFCVKTAE